MANSWQLVLFILQFIACSECKLLLRSPECPTSGVSFGGRLIFQGDGRWGSTRFSPLAIRGRVIIFQTPPTNLRSHMGSGWGQIRIGSRSCQRSVSQPDQCAWNDNRPCLDEGIPCETELQANPTGRQSDASPCTGLNLGVENMRLEEDTGKFRANVTWQLPSLQGNCAPAYHKLTLHQLDFDNCTYETKPKEVTIELEKQFRRIKRLFPNTKYDITLLVRNQAGMTHVTSQVFRTPSTVPGGVDGLTSTPTSSGVRFSWNEPQCGERNGIIQRYEYAVNYNRKKKLRDFILPSGMPTQEYILESSSIRKWRFRVKACNEEGCGDFMSTQDEIS